MIGGPPVSRHGDCDQERVGKPDNTAADAVGGVFMRGRHRLHRSSRHDGTPGSIYRLPTQISPSFLDSNSDPRLRRRGVGVRRAGMGRPAEKLKRRNATSSSFRRFGIWFFRRFYELFPPLGGLFGVALARLGGIPGVVELHDGPNPA